MPKGTPDFVSVYRNLKVWQHLRPSFRLISSLSYLRVLNKQFENEVSKVCGLATLFRDGEENQTTKRDLPEIIYLSILV